MEAHLLTWRQRGTMLAYIFANQGWGSLVGALMTMIVLAAYKHVMDAEGETSKVHLLLTICSRAESGFV